MNAIVADLRRSICSKSFLVAVLLTFFLLWTGLGAQSSIVIQQLSSGEKIFWNFLLYMALTSPSSLLTLPLLAALPYGSAALQERQANAFRYAIMRTGRTPYCIGKLVGSFVSAVLVQFIALIVVVVIGLLFFDYDVGYVETTTLINCIISRLICAGLWGCMAGIMAFVSKVSTAAFIAPLAISYSLSMLGRRLLPQLSAIDPDKWMRGEHILLICIVTLVVGFVYFFVLRREIKRA